MLHAPMASPPKLTSSPSLLPSENLPCSSINPVTPQSTNIEVKPCGDGNAICSNRKAGIVTDEVSKVTPSTSIPSTDHHSLQERAGSQFKSSSLPSSPTKENPPRSLEQLRAEILKMRNPNIEKAVTEDHKMPRPSPENAGSKPSFPSSKLCSSKALLLDSSCSFMQGESYNTHSDEEPFSVEGTIQNINEMPAHVAPSSSSLLPFLKVHSSSHSHPSSQSTLHTRLAYYPQTLCITRLMANTKLGSRSHHSRPLPQLAHSYNHFHLTLPYLLAWKAVNPCTIL